MSTHVIIMAGGIGSRFWPMSTPDCPKQFIDILGCGKTMIQATVDRFLPICPPENIWIVTSKKYSSFLKEQLPQIPQGNILFEPAMRSTAPCIAYACWKIKSVCPDANIVVSPSDALVLDTVEFDRVISKALSFTAGNSAIVTVGIKPTRPDTGYGYIHATIPEGDEEVLKVSDFREKPDLSTAEGYLKDGHFLWNAGIFVWNAATIEEEIRTHAPSIAAIMDSLDDGGDIEELYPRCEKISIDYAVMEKSCRIFTIPSSFGWSDLGSWGSLLANMAERDADGNASAGAKVQLHGSRGCIVRAGTLKRIVVKGLDGYIVAENGGNLLICPLKDEQSVSDLSKE